MRKIKNLVLMVAVAAVATGCNTDTGKETKKKYDEARGLGLKDGAFQPPGTPTPTPNQGDATTIPFVNDLPEFVQASHLVRGSSEPGALVRVFVNGTLSAQDNAEEDGSWSIRATGLQEGPIAVTADATGIGKETSDQSEPRNSTVDATAPEAPTITGPASPVAISQPIITGTGEALAAAVVLFEGEEVASVAIGADGNWSYQVPIDLDNGEYAVTAIARDRAGNESPESEVFTFTIALEEGGGPTPTPEPGITTGVPAVDELPDFIGADFTVTGSSEAGAVVRVFVNDALRGEGVADEEGSWEVELTGLPEGAVSIRADAQVGAKAPSELSDPRLSVVDATPPLAPVVTGFSFAGDGRIPTLTGTAEAGSIVVVLIDGDPFDEADADNSGVWTLELPSDIEPGSYTVIAVAFDEAGNESPESEPFVVNIPFADPAP